MRPGAAAALIVAVVMVGAPLAMQAARLPKAAPAVESPLPTEEGSPGTPPGLRIPADLVAKAAAEGGLDSIRVRFTDGRLPASFPVYRTSEGAYLDLGDFGNIAGGGFQWNPETWRGSVRTDSAEIDFVLDTAVFWVRGEAVQLPSAVRYEAESVRIPLVAVDALLEPLLGERCRWDPFTGSLEVAPPKPWLEDLSLSGGGSSAALTLEPAGVESMRLRWDPLGWLRVEVEGVHLPPAFHGSTGRVEGCEVESVIPSRRGFEILLRLDPAWAGLRLHPGRGSRSAVLDLTSRPGDVGRGRYQPLQYYLSPPAAERASSRTGRRILLEVSGPQGSASLQTLRDQLQGILEKDFGHEVVEVPDRATPGRLSSPSGLPETPALPSGDCWIGLCLESWPGAGVREFLLVTPGEASRQELVSSIASIPGQGQGAAVPESEAGFGSGSRMIPWGQVSRLFRQPSEKLARTIADHLNYEWEGREVRIVRRPARLFRGAGLPSVLIYPAVSSDQEALAALSDPAKTGELARNLAFALDEFLMNAGGE